MQRHTGGPGTRHLRSNLNTEFARLSALLTEIITHRKFLGRDIYWLLPAQIQIADYFPIQSQKRCCERTQRKKRKSKTERARRGEERRRRRPKHVTLREKDGRGWPGPAVARMAPQCGIGASILMETGQDHLREEKVYFCFVCVCLSLRVSVSAFPCLRVHNHACEGKKSGETLVEARSNTEG